MFCDLVDSTQLSRQLDPEDYRAVVRAYQEAAAAVIQRFDLATEKIVPGAYPYGVVVSRDGRRAYISLWNASRVAELDLKP